MVTMLLVANKGLAHAGLDTYTVGQPVMLLAGRKGPDLWLALEIGELGGRELPQHLLTHGMAPLHISSRLLLLQGKLMLSQPLNELRLCAHHDGQ